MPSYTTTAFLTVAVVVGSTESKRIYEKATVKGYKDKGVMSPVLAGFVLGVFLFALGIFNEKIATYFCVLLIIGSVIRNGDGLFAVLNKVGGVTNG